MGEKRKEKKEEGKPVLANPSCRRIRFTSCLSMICSLIWCFVNNLFPYSHVKNDKNGTSLVAVVTNPPANAGDMGSSTDPGRSHMLRSN